MQQLLEEGGMQHLIVYGDGELAPIFIMQHATITDGDRAAIKRASDEQSGFEAMCWPGTRLSPLLLHACFMAAKLLCSVMSMTAESSYNYGGTQT